MKQQKEWITFRVSLQEMRAIEAYCLQTKRTKTDVIRELIRRLPTYTADLVTEMYPVQSLD